MTMIMMVVVAVQDQYRKKDNIMVVKIREKWMSRARFGKENKLTDKHTGIYRIYLPYSIFLRKRNRSKTRVC